MAWALSAHGDCPEDDERDLARKIAALLAQARYGTGGSQMSGEVHNGPVHHVPKPAPRKGKAG